MTLYSQRSPCFCLPGARIKCPASMFFEKKILELEGMWIFGELSCVWFCLLFSSQQTHWCVSGSQFNNSFPTKLESWIHYSSSQQCACLTVLKTEAIDLFFILQNTWGQRTVYSALSNFERQKMILFSSFIISSPWQSILNPLQKKNK